jgi:hypothetical protein
LKKIVLGALALCGACSLRSLDHLESGSAVGGSAAGGETGGSLGSASGSANGGALANGGVAGTAAGGVSEAGRDPGMADAGAAGMPPELPDCEDGQVTVDETDRDCGGRTCGPCEAEMKCVTGSDCQSAICTNQICQPPTCTDLALNGTETDLNCGGGCPACINGQHCAVSSDCASESCQESVCVTPSCSDDVLQDGCPLLADNTPYAFSPSHALTKCVDDDNQSVADGNGMVLYDCKLEIHRTFWTMAQPDGYFALRNALSGKCLHVRGASKVDGATVEQRSCSLVPEQLWKPTRVSSSLMQLTAKHSGLVLDVAGDRVANDSLGIVQGLAGNSADKLWHAQKRAAAAFIALSPYDDQTIRLRHSDSAVTVTDDDAASAHWKVIPGLADVTGVSFQSRDEPGRYLRHAGFRMWADKNDGSTVFKRDATFRYASPFIGTTSLSRGLESFNYSGRFLLRTGDNTVTLSQSDTTDAYKNGATWWIGAR